MSPGTIELSFLVQHSQTEHDYLSNCFFTFTEIALDYFTFVLSVAYREMFKTKTIKDNDNPVWNETFDATVLDKYRGKIQFQVFDDDGKIVNVDYLGK